MSGSISFPLVMTAQGAQPTPPATLNAAVIAQATSEAPQGLSILPGGLVEDMSSTATGALIEIDAERVDFINSMTPYGANAFILLQLGQIYLGQGSTAAAATNTSVYVQFSGTGGFAIAPGFVVSDGSHQYTVTDGGIVSASGVSGLVFAQATTAGSWAVPAGSVTQIVTSLPANVTLSVTNPAAGTPGLAAQTEESFRAQVLQAGLVGSAGMPNYLRTLLQKVPGVISQLISIRKPAAGQWEIIVGGTGDPYQIGLAIFSALQDVSTLVGSTIHVTGVTQANPGVVTTDLNHGYVTGQVVTFSGVGGMTELNTGSFAADVLSAATFSLLVAPIQTAPTLTASASGGTLATGTLYAQLTMISTDGETTPSPEASVSVTGPAGSVVIPSPGTLTGATGYKVYAAGTSGAEAVQNSGSSIAIGTNYTLTALATGGAVPPTSNTAGVDTSGFTAFTTGGTVLPNFRNTSVTINQYPDSYTIPIVLPPVQTVTMVVTWNTSSSNYVAAAGVEQLAQAPLAAYINALPVAAPINQLELNDVFIAAVASILPENLISRLVFTVYINSVQTAWPTGEQIITGDPESYWTCAAASVTVQQG